MMEVLLLTCSSGVEQGTLFNGIWGSVPGTCSPCFRIEYVEKRVFHRIDTPRLFTSRLVHLCNFQTYNTGEGHSVSIVSINICWIPNLKILIIFSAVNTVYIAISFGGRKDRL